MAQASHAETCAWLQSRGSLGIPRRPLSASHVPYVVLSTSPKASASEKTGSPMLGTRLSVWAGLKGVRLVETNAIQIASQTENIEVG